MFYLTSASGLVQLMSTSTQKKSRLREHAGTPAPWSSRELYEEDKRLDERIHAHPVAERLEDVEDAVWFLELPALQQDSDRRARGAILCHV